MSYRCPLYHPCDACHLDLHCIIFVSRDIGLWIHRQETSQRCDSLWSTFSQWMMTASFAALTVLIFTDLSLICSSLTSRNIRQRITSLNKSLPGQNGRRFEDDIFKCIFMNLKLCVFIRISLTFVPKFPINNITALVQIIAWRRPGDNPLSEPMMTQFTDACMRH